ncbi:DUF2163 domain-containing protein [Paracoccaceae bacterium Fryx2]|nr:DUF2163 domain-containing protein [Paracoccaceae bacterium Fryx2]
MKGLYEHLAGGITTVCRCWAVVRRDAVVLGFTDHDRDLAFEGVAFRADSGLTARALQQTTGLSVDNSEAMGALSDAAVSEADLLAGRFDGAEVRAWLVNWASVEDRVLQFRGTFGEIVRAGGAFQVELRGLTEALNQPQGRVYQRDCSAVLGDGGCRVDLGQPGYFAERAVELVEDRRVFRFAEFRGFDDRWFERGRLVVLSGAAVGMVGVIKNDRLSAAGREVELWQSLGPQIGPGDLVRLEAGCDRRGETCRLKFNNFINFRGFPYIPGEDWLTTYPVSAGMNDGGSLAR